MATRPAARCANPGPRRRRRVSAYLQALAAAGLEVPAPLGRDEQGRQVTGFVNGPLTMEAPPLTASELQRVGALVRSIHDASASFTPAAEAGWETLLPPPATDLICRDDLAPWNLLLGERWVFIDWDGAGPSTRVWDLAYAAQTFTLNDPKEGTPQAARRLAAFIGGYGADDALRAQLPRTMAQRTGAMFDLLERSQRDGRKPWETMFLRNHGEHWRAASEYVGRHQAVWTAALAPGRDDRRRGGQPTDQQSLLR